MGSKTYNVHLSTETKERHLRNLTEEQFHALMRTWKSRNNATPELMMLDEFGRSTIRSFIIERGNVIELKAEEVTQQ